MQLQKQHMASKRYVPPAPRSFFVAASVCRCHRTASRVLSYESKAVAAKRTFSFCRTVSRVHSYESNVVAAKRTFSFGRTASRLGRSCESKVVGAEKCTVAAVNQFMLPQAYTLQRQKLPLPRWKRTPGDRRGSLPEICPWVG